MNENGIKMVKLSKEEQEKEKKELKKTVSKRKTVFETEEDKQIKKRYQKLVLATASIFLCSVLVLAGMVSGFLNNQFGIALLLIFCGTSTYITRKFK